MTSTPENIIRVSISEAAKLLGIDPHTIRRAIKRQEVRYIVVQGRYKINFESLITWSQSRTTTLNKLNNRGIGQFVDKWKIKNKKFSPNPGLFREKDDNKTINQENKKANDDTPNIT